MSNIIKININFTVRVKLTDFGREMHRKDHVDFWTAHGRPDMRYHPPVTDSDGWSRFQLWSLMQCFGNHVSLGSVPPFETEIEYDMEQR